MVKQKNEQKKNQKEIMDSTLYLQFYGPSLLVHFICFGQAAAPIQSDLAVFIRAAEPMNRYSYSSFTTLMTEASISS
jgi:hypothetical protein